MRTTYFIEPHPDVFSHLSSPDADASPHGVQVSELRAAKHVRDRRSTSQPIGIHNVKIEYSDGRCDLYGLPFDPPARVGFFISASLDSLPERVTEAVSNLGFHFDVEKYGPLETEDYYYWFVPWNEVNIDADSGSPAANGIRISLSDGTTITETWYGYQLWNEFVPATGEIGIFTIENRLNSLVLNGRVRTTDKDTPIRENGESFGDPMMIRWYPKHQKFSGSFAKVDIEEPYGLHPKMSLSLTAGAFPNNLPFCRLFAQIDLSTDFFFDRYEFDDLAQVSPPLELIALSGDNDLEKPKWQAHEPVSGLFGLHDYNSHTGTNYTIPLHFRYQLPNDKEIVYGEIMSPFVFWACKNDDMPDRDPEYIEPYEMLGIESVFPIENTQMFVIPSNTLPFRVPTIGQSTEKFAEQMTVLVVVVGTLVVLMSVLTKLLRKAPKQKLE